MCYHVGNIGSRHSACLHQWLSYAIVLPLSLRTRSKTVRGFRTKRKVHSISSTVLHVLMMPKMGAPGARVLRTAEFEIGDLHPGDALYK